MYESISNQLIRELTIMISFIWDDMKKILNNIRNMSKKRLKTKFTLAVIFGILLGIGEVVFTIATSSIKYSWLPILVTLSILGGFGLVYSLLLDWHYYLHIFTAPFHGKFPFFIAFLFIPCAMIPYTFFAFVMAFYGIFTMNKWRPEDGTNN